MTRPLPSRLDETTPASRRPARWRSPRPLPAPRRAPPRRAARASSASRPQTALTDSDAAYMKAGGIGSVRWPLAWAAVQPTPKGGYDWSGFDEAVEVAARARAAGPALPLRHAALARRASRRRCRSTAAGSAQAWTAFLNAAVERYGPGGEFWNEHAPRRRPAQLRAGDPDGRCRSAPGRSGTRPTSSTSPTRSRRAATRSC